MPRLNRDQVQALRDFVVQNVEDHKGDIGRLVADTFQVSRTTAAKHLRALVEDGAIRASGNTRAREHFPVVVSHVFSVKVDGLEEDRLWRDTVLPLVKPAPDNVLSICQWGFTEMVNNAMEHSETDKMEIKVRTTGATISLIISDEGIGIFNKIQRDHNLNDPRHALLELSKGKLTSDEEHHSGEGIFFTSRMVDKFMIESGELAFLRHNKKDDWLLQVEDTQHRKGTLIFLEISRTATQTTQEIQERFAIPSGDFDFSKTHVPLKLAVYESERLVSRSQAKRLLARVEKFREVMLDFEGVDTIGQAFADEIFRVFQNAHPGVEIVPIHAKPRIQGMITRVQQGLVPGSLLEN